MSIFDIINRASVAIADKLFRRDPPSPPVYEALSIDDDGWLVGVGVTRIPMDPSWRYHELLTPHSEPIAIVAHYTATNPGTAIVMANNRIHPFDAKKGDRAASWHLSIEAGGALVQMAPFKVGTWHAGSDTAKQIPGVGWANRTAIGIELVGHGQLFPEEQVIGACRVWRALAKRYPITQRNAAWGHVDIDPKRRSDPGPVWKAKHLERVLSYAFA